jgi:antirestriction protein ArdC
MKSAELFAQITDRIAAQIDAGVAPWRKPWTADSAGLPRNVSGRAYRGANTFWLALAQAAKGYPTPVWLTYKQAQAAGGSVRKGETGTAVFFWNFSEKTNAATGKVEKVVWAKVYTVFNVAQCDGIEVAAPPARTQIERHADAEHVIAATGAVIRHGGDRAFYSPSADVVCVPHAETFVDRDAYYATVFHEIGHWTGAKARLDRQFGKRFGDDAYAFEELVAELTAAFVCASVGVSNPDREDHAAYLGHWSRILKADPKAFITAAGKAQAAADYILATAAQSEEEDASQLIAA